MTALTVVATVGWIGFGLTALLYYVGNRANSEENNALSIYCVALVLSDEFRDSDRASFESVLRDGESKGMNAEALVYGLMKGVTLNALAGYKNYKNEEGIRNTSRFVVGIIQHRVKAS